MAGSASFFLLPTIFLITCRDTPVHCVSGMFCSKERPAMANFSPLSNPLPHAVQLYSLRLQSLPQISKALSQSYLSLTNETEQADLAYAPDLSIESIEQYLEKLAEERPRDRIMGSTAVKVRTAMIFFSAYKRGMHELMLPKGNSGFVLALRLAEFSYLRQALVVFHFGR